MPHLILLCMDPLALLTCHASYLIAHITCLWLFTFFCMFGCICFFSIDAEYEGGAQEFYYPSEDHASDSTSDLTGEPSSLYLYYILPSLYILALCYDALLSHVSYPPVYPKQNPISPHTSYYLVLV
jgi:hypothetical protein